MRDTEIQSGKEPTTKISSACLRCQALSNIPLTDLQEILDEQTTTADREAPLGEFQRRHVADLKLVRTQTFLRLQLNHIRRVFERSENFLAAQNLRERTDHKLREVKRSQLSLRARLEEASTPSTLALVYHDCDLTMTGPSSLGLHQVPAGQSLENIFIVFGVVIKHAEKFECEPVLNGFLLRRFENADDSLVIAFCEHQTTFQHNKQAPRASSADICTTTSTYLLSADLETWQHHLRTPHLNSTFHQLVRELRPRICKS
eukprot:767365-Hanusia_phi.AAC.8